MLRLYFYAYRFIFLWWVNVDNFTILMGKEIIPQIFIFTGAFSVTYFSVNFGKILVI